MSTRQADLEAPDRLVPVAHSEGVAAFRQRRYVLDRPVGRPIESVGLDARRVAIELEARFVKGKTSVDAYIEQTAIANPHAMFTYTPPSMNGDRRGDTADDQQDLIPEFDSAATPEPAPESYVETATLDDRIIFPRTVDELPPETREIKPHPYGVELGTFLRMLKDTSEQQLGGFLKHEFCCVTPSVARDVYKAGKVSGNTWLKSIDYAAAEKIYRALQDARLRGPPTDCLAPMGVRQMLAGLLKGVRAEFYSAATRSPAVYRGNPFQIEAAVAFGGDLPADQPARVIRFANRVPLLYQQSSCSAFKSVVDASWRTYGLTQPRGSLPVGPIVVMIHMVSVWVPFTSESKEAIADYDEIRKEMKLALQECGRKLGTYLRRRQRMKRDADKRDVFERYIGEIARSCHALTGTDPDALYQALIQQARRRTEIADAQLDDEGRFIASSENGRLDDDEGVLIIDRNETGPRQLDATEPAEQTAESTRTPARKSPRKKTARKTAKRPASGRAPKPAKPRVRVQLQAAGDPSLFPHSDQPARRSTKKTGRKPR